MQSLPTGSPRHSTTRGQEMNEVSHTGCQNSHDKYGCDGEVRTHNSTAGNYSVTMCEMHWTLFREYLHRMASA